MKAVVQLVLQYSGWLTFFLLLPALLNGIFVCEGLWQGSGLHGDTIQPGSKGGPPRVVSTWDAFVEMLVFIGFAALSGLIALWQGRVKLRLGKAGVVENPGRENVLRTRRKMRKSAEKVTRE